MTAPDAAGTPDSRSTPGPGQALDAFHAWMDDQYPDGRRFEGYGGGDMRDAFEGGMHAQAAIAAAAPAGTAARRWDCEFCPLSFDRLSAAEEHVRTEHLSLGDAEEHVHSEQPQAAPELAAAMAATEVEVASIIAERNQLRIRLERLIDWLKTTASSTHPSKKSEIEFALIRKLQAILDQP